MESVQSKLSVSAMTAYFGIFKEPRGLIRLLQFIFAIFAFATACNGRSSVFGSNTNNNTDISASWSYPYNLQSALIIISQNGNATPIATVSDSNDIKPSAEFFVFTGVTSMLLSLALLVIYVLFDRQYRNNDRFPLVDFIVSIIWTIFWFAGSAAWAKGVSNIRSQTDWGNIALRSASCGDGSCVLKSSGTYANVIVSVIFGFLNFLLWLGGVWFVYKETKFFKSRNAQPNNFANIGSPTMQGQPQSRPPGSLG